MNTETILTSLYGMKLTPSKKSEKYYDEQRKKAIETLGHRYVLSKPMPRVK